MPILKIFTNISKNGIPNNFIPTVISVLSECVKKPEERFMVTISTDCIMSVNGNDNPSVIATFESIGHLGPKQNPLISKYVTECIAKEFGVDKNHVIITFYHILPYNVAKNGVTC